MSLPVRPYYFSQYTLKRLSQEKCSGKTYAVFSMLADKDISSSLGIIKNEIDAWYVAPLACKRSASEDYLKTCFEAEDGSMT